jgi:hypothetical protein
MSEVAACSGCDAPLSEGQRFCRRCGTPVAAAAAPTPAPPRPASSTGCPTCGHALVPNARFCRGCGAALTTAAAAARPSREQPSPVASPRLLGTDPERWRPTQAEIERPAPPPPAARAPPAIAPRPTPPRPSATRVRARQLTAVVVLAALVVAGGMLVGGALSGGGGSALPSVSRAEMTRQIRAMLVDYHQALVDRRLDDAFTLISDRKQQEAREEQGGLAEWRKVRAAFGRHIDPSGLRVRIEDADAKTGDVQVAISGMPYDSPSSDCKTWSGLTWVRYEHGAFRYDPGYGTTPERRSEWEPRRTELLGWGCETS